MLILGSVLCVLVTCDSTNADTWFCFVCAGILVIPLMLILGSVSVRDMVQGIGLKSSHEYIFV